MNLLPFEKFVAWALYGPDGFYIKSDCGSAGRRGDFITSPEIGPLFGAVIARYLDAEWRRLGEPDGFTVVDAGAGRGTLARSILAAAPRCLVAGEYIAVELSISQRAYHPADVRSQEQLPDEPITGVVVANELLDNRPFRLAVYDGGWREAFVDVSDPARLTEQLSAPFDPVPSVLPASAGFGARAPLVDQAAAWVDEAQSLVTAGTVLVVDYGVENTAELAARPWREWLRTYRGHERGDHYLHSPGSQDITTDVPLDQLPEPSTLQTQTQFLQLYGIDELVEEGRRVWAEQAVRPGLEAMTMRSRISESEALLNPSGLGAFFVAEYRC